MNQEEMQELAQNIFSISCNIMEGVFVGKLLDYTVQNGLEEKDSLKILESMDLEDACRGHVLSSFDEWNVEEGAFETEEDSQEFKEFVSNIIKLSYKHFKKNAPWEKAINDRYKVLMNLTSKANGDKYES